jgi:hypothetical protein
MRRMRSSFSKGFQSRETQTCEAFVARAAAPESPVMAVCESAGVLTDSRGRQLQRSYAPGCTRCARVPRGFARFQQKRSSENLCIIGGIKKRINFGATARHEQSAETMASEPEKRLAAAGVEVCPMIACNRC